MSASPSRPVKIANNNILRQADDDFASGSPGPGFGFGTPGRSGVQRQGTPSTPTIANIPPRIAFDGSPRNVGGFPGSFGAQSRTPQTGGSSTPTGVPLGESPLQGRVALDDVTDEEMARVLRRHLVPRRVGDGDETPTGGISRSRRTSDSGPAASTPQRHQQEASETFPIPYDAPGGDITYVFILDKGLKIH